MTKNLIMSAEIDAHITKKYEIKKRLGKGVRPLLICRYDLAPCAPFLFCRLSSILLSLSMFNRLMESSGKL